MRIPLIVSGAQITSWSVMYQPPANSPSRLIFAMQQRISQTFTEPDWHELAWYCDARELILEHPGLLPALRSGDPIYRVHVFDILAQLVKCCPAGELAEYLDLRCWLADHHPALFEELYDSGTETPIGDLAAFAATGELPELGRQIRRIRATVSTDPEVAIGQAKELLETVMKYILGEHGADRDIDIIKLAKRTREQLGLNGGSANTYRNRTLSNLTQIVEGITKIRNLVGTGHGRSQAPEPDAANARLVVDSAAALALFFLTLHRQQTDRRFEEPS
jgi:hypothetical protein